jgi:hypothetical protein
MQHADLDGTGLILDLGLTLGHGICSGFQD